MLVLHFFCRKVAFFAKKIWMLKNHTVSLHQNLILLQNLNPPGEAPPPQPQSPGATSVAPPFFMS